MKKYTYGIIPFCLVIILCFFIQRVSAQTAPTNPTLSLSVSGTSVSLSWSADNADTYILYAAPYPDASVIYDFDMGSLTSISFELPAGSAFYLAVRASNNTGMSDFSNIEYFNLSQDTPPSSVDCGAYVAPGVWKEFDCYNLAAIGKTNNDDPFTPSWRLIGGYWQWGRKGPDPSQWYDTNTENFAHGPTGSGSSAANEGGISGFNWETDAPNEAWSDTKKTENDPCFDGYRVPSKSQWDGVRDNNPHKQIGTWSGIATDYTSAYFFGDSLMLPAAGQRSNAGGSLKSRSFNGYYWSTSWHSDRSSWYLNLLDSPNGMLGTFRTYGLSVRCVME